MRIGQHFLSFAIGLVSLVCLVSLPLLPLAPAGPVLEAPFFLRGDTNSDGQLNVADAVSTLNFLFKEGTAPPCLDAVDTNDDGQLDVSDPIATLLVLFSSGRELPFPGQIPGSDRTADELPCASGLAFTSVIGTVVHQETRASLAGVKVSIGSVTAFTKADGRFWLKSPPVGVQTLRVDSTAVDPSFTVREVSVEVFSNRVVDLGEIAVIGDTAPPSGTLKINDDAPYSRSATVTLTLSATDNAGTVTRMRFSNDNVTFTPAEPFATAKRWDLSAGDGEKTAYGKFQDAAGNWSNAVADTIVLDTTPPTGSMAIQAGAAFTTSTQVTLTLTGSDATSGVDQMRFSLNRGATWTAWEAFAPMKSLTLPSGDGNKEVLFQLQDRVGHVSSFPDTIVLDTVAPSGSVVINGGAAYTLSQEVTVTLTGSDATSGIEAVRFSPDAGAAWTDWEAQSGNTIAIDHSLTLPAGSGTKEVLAEVRDRAGHVSQFRDGILIPLEVSVVNAGSYHEITNGLTGVRIPLESSFNPSNPRYTQAPIQAIRHADGTWSHAVPIYLSAPTAPTGMTVRFLKETPEEVTAQVSYTFDKPPFYYGDQFFEPAGPGYYRLTVTVQRGEPVVINEVDGNYEVSYSLSITEGLSPTHGRYRGHHSNSVESGYGPDGRPYQQLNEQGLRLDATVDLQYEVRRDYRNLAVWDPWAYDSGWYWQFYNASAGPEANLLGIFAGHASKAIGAQETVSGVHLYTLPEAVTDQAIACDEGGNCHYVWQTGNELWYLAIGASEGAGSPKKLAEGLIYPYVAAREGRFSIVAFDPIGGPLGKGQFVLIQRDSSGTFQTTPIDLGSTLVLEPFGYFASSSTADLLLIFGERQTQRGLLLFARNPGERTFTFQEAVTDVHDQAQNDIYSRTTQNRRPDFRTLSDGRVVLLYTDSGGWAAYGVIPSGQKRFAFTQRFPWESFRILYSGAAIDPGTGRMMVMDNTQWGGVSLLIPNGQQLAATQVKTSVEAIIGHHGQGPNRRTLATDLQGNALAVHEDEFFLYRASAQAWEKLTAANSLGLASQVVTYDSANQRFNLVGRYRGKLAHFVFAVEEGTPRLFRTLDGTEKPVAGLQVSMGRRSWSAQYFPRIRYEFGIFAGTKGRDLKDPLEIQPIALAMNRHGGLADGRLERYETSDYTDSPALFMPVEAIRRIIQRVQTDLNYYRYLYNADPTIRDLIDAWRDRTGVKLQETIAVVLNLAEGLKRRLTEGDGIYDFFIHYWHGGLEMMRSGIRIALLLADERTTAEDRRRLKEAAALFGSILWDDDFVPLSLFSINGLNAGTENMPIQQQAYRDYYAMLLQQHPDFTARAQGVAERTLQTLRRIINEYGAEIGSPHYIGASLEPTLIQALQLKQSGVVDLFRTDDRLRKFAEFYMNLLTPPEIRFGRKRKLVSIGDGSTEGTEIPGMLATGFRDVDPELSARLMGAWNQGGKVHIGFFGSTVLMIDEEAPAKDPGLGNGNFPGYLTVLRHGWGTSDESALWFINGDFYRDHRHSDQGSFVLYALGVPLSVDWGSLYAPHAPGARMHNVVLKASWIPWNENELPSLDDYFQRKTALQEVGFFQNSSFAKANITSLEDNTVWERFVRSLHHDSSLPLFAIYDKVDGPDDFVFSLNLMAQGEVDTPAGRVSPPLRTYRNPDDAQGPLEFPSLGTVFQLSPGLNRLGFTGQWGVDFEVYVLSQNNQEARIGNWAHRWHPGTEHNEFRQAQNRPFEERQHILRIKGMKEFQAVVLPYRKNQKPSDLLVSNDGSDLWVTYGGKKVVIGPTSWAYQDTNLDSLTTAGSDSVERFGLRISGGTAEVQKGADRVTITVHGLAGLRRIRVTGNWRPAPSSEGQVTFDSASGDWQVDYPGGAPMTLLLDPA